MEAVSDPSTAGLSGSLSGSSGGALKLLKNRIRQRQSVDSIPSLTSVNDSTTSTGEANTYISAMGYPTTTSIAQPNGMSNAAPGPVGFSASAAQAAHPVIVGRASSQRGSSPYHPIPSHAPSTVPTMLDPLDINASSGSSTYKDNRVRRSPRQRGSADAFTFSHQSTPNAIGASSSNPSSTDISPSNTASGSVGTTAPPPRLAPLGYVDSATTTATSGSQLTQTTASSASSHTAVQLLAARVASRRNTRPNLAPTIGDTAGGSSGSNSVNSQSPAGTRGSGSIPLGFPQTAAMVTGPSDVPVLPQGVSVPGSTGSFAAVSTAYHHALPPSGLVRPSAVSPVNSQAPSAFSPLFSSSSSSGDQNYSHFPSSAGHAPSGFALGQSSVIAPHVPSGLPRFGHGIAQPLSQSHIPVPARRSPHQPSPLMHAPTPPPAPPQPKPQENNEHPHHPSVSFSSSGVSQPSVTQATTESGVPPIAAKGVPRASTAKATATQSNSNPESATTTTVSSQDRDMSKKAVDDSPTPSVPSGSSKAREGDTSHNAPSHSQPSHGGSSTFIPRPRSAVGQRPRASGASHASGMPPPGSKRGVVLTSSNAGSNAIASPSRHVVSRKPPLPSAAVAFGSPNVHGGDSSTGNTTVSAGKGALGNRSSSLHRTGPSQQPTSQHPGDAHHVVDPSPTSPSVSEGDRQKNRRRSDPSQSHSPRHAPIGSLDQSSDQLDASQGGQLNVLTSSAKRRALDAAVALAMQLDDDLDSTLDDREVHDDAVDEGLVDENTTKPDEPGTNAQNTQHHSEAPGSIHNPQRAVAHTGKVAQSKPTRKLGTGVDSAAGTHKQSIKPPVPRVARATNRISGANPNERSVGGRVAGGKLDSRSQPKSSVKPSESHTSAGKQVVTTLGRQANTTSSSAADTTKSTDDGVEEHKSADASETQPSSLAASAQPASVGKHNLRILTSRRQMALNSTQPRVPSLSMVTDGSVGTVQEIETERSSFIAQANLDGIYAGHSRGIDSMTVHSGDVAGNEVGHPKSSKAAETDKSDLSLDEDIIVSNDGVLATVMTGDPNDSAHIQDEIDEQFQLSQDHAAASSVPLSMDPVIMGNSPSRRNPKSTAASPSGHSAGVVSPNLSKHGENKRLAPTTRSPRNQVSTSSTNSNSNASTSSASVVRRLRAGGLPTHASPSNATTAKKTTVTSKSPLPVSAGDGGLAQESSLVEEMISEFTSNSELHQTNEDATGGVSMAASIYIDEDDDIEVDPVGETDHPDRSDHEVAIADAAPHEETMSNSTSALAVAISATGTGATLSNQLKQSLARLHTRSRARRSLNLSLNGEASGESTSPRAADGTGSASQNSGLGDQSAAGSVINTARPTAMSAINQLITPLRTAVRPPQPPSSTGAASSIQGSGTKVSAATVSALAKPRKKRVFRNKYMPATFKENPEGDIEPGFGFLTSSNSTSALLPVGARSPEFLGVSDAKSPGDRSSIGAMSIADHQQLQTLRSTWSEIGFLLRSPINSQDDYIEVVAQALDALRFIHQLGHLAEITQLPRGRLVRVLLPFNNETNVADQASNARVLAQRELMRDPEAAHKINAYFDNPRFAAQAFLTLARGGAHSSEVAAAIRGECEVTTAPYGSHAKDSMAAAAAAAAATTGAADAPPPIQPWNSITDMVDAATRLRKLVRVKIADENDLAQAQSAVEVVARFAVALKSRLQRFNEHQEDESHPESLVKEYGGIHKFDDYEFIVKFLE